MKSKAEMITSSLTSEPHSLVSGPDLLSFWATAHSGLAEADSGFPGGDPS